MNRFSDQLTVLEHVHVELCWIQSALQLVIEDIEREFIAEFIGKPAALRARLLEEVMHMATSLLSESLEKYDVAVASLYTACRKEDAV